MIRLKSRNKQKTRHWRWKIAQAAEIRWWRRYLRGKSPESYLRDKRRYWRRVLATLEVDLPASAKVLDAGCGPAGIFIALPGCRVDAIDPLLEKYQKHLPHFDPKTYSWVNFRQMTIEALDRTDAYDHIFCLNAINHVADLRQSLRRLYAAGRPGSRLILSIDSHKYQLFRRLFSLLPGDILHPHQFYLREYLDMLTKTGWKIERTHRLKEGFFFDYYGIVARK